MQFYENYFRISFLVIACSTSRGQLTLGQEYMNKDASSAGTGSPYQREEPQDWRKTLPTTPPCSQPVETGPCKRSVERWFYNMTSQQCEKFFYGGCGGGRNNFRSFEECRSFCMSIQVTTGTMTSSNSSDYGAPTSDSTSAPHNNLGVNADQGSNPSSGTRQDPYVNIKIDMNAMNSRLTKNQQYQSSPGYSGSDQTSNGNKGLENIPVQESNNQQSQPSPSYSGTDQTPNSNKGLENIPVQEPNNQQSQPSPNYSGTDQTPNSNKGLENIPVQESNNQQSQPSPSYSGTDQTPNSNKGLENIPVQEPNNQQSQPSPGYSGTDQTPNGNKGLENIPVQEPNNQQSQPSPGYSGTDQTPNGNKGLENIPVQEPNNQQSQPSPGISGADQTLNGNKNLENIPVQGPNNAQSQPSLGYSGTDQRLNGNKNLDNIPAVQEPLTENTTSFTRDPLHAVVNINIVCKFPPCPQPTTSNATTVTPSTYVTPSPSVTQSSINYTVKPSTASPTLTSTPAPVITAPTAPAVSPQITVTVTSTIFPVLPPSILLPLVPGISPNTTEVVPIPPLALNSSSTVVVTTSIVPASTVTVTQSVSQAVSTSVTPPATAVPPTAAQNTTCRRANDVGIVLDSSMSTKPDDFYKVKQFLVNFTEKFEVSTNATHFSLIAYSQESGFYFNFSNNDFWDHKTLGDNIHSLPWIALQTRTDKALELVDSSMFTAENGDRADTPDTLIVVAFGKTDPKESKPYEIVMAPLKKRPIKIIAVGVGPAIDRDELLLIANGDASHVFKIDSTSDLSSFVDSLAMLACR